MGTLSLASDLSSNVVIAVVLFLAVTILYTHIYKPLFATSLRRVPGPKSFAATKWRLALADYRGTRTPLIHSLHQEHGSVVRIGPNEVSFSSLTALRKIYGAGSGFERTAFYRMFDVYGRQNLFTFASTKAHAERKKLLAHAYSKSMILSPDAIAKPLIERNVGKYLDLLKREKDTPQEIFQSLHWFSLDSITGFLYGEGQGGTQALQGDEAHKNLLNDIIDPSRRLLSWFAVHLKNYTKWLYSQTGAMESLIKSLGLLPMSKPATYTGIRVHALQAWSGFEALKTTSTSSDDDGTAIMDILYRQNGSKKTSSLDGLDMASELADHFLAGIDTTSDTLMFAIWALSRPENRRYQQSLIDEVSKIPAVACNDDGVPALEATDKLPYLDAVLKETLRLYAPLPASEPRSLPTDTTIDGYLIPAGTVVSMSPYTLHRNPDVFTDPLKFDPERWLDEAKVPEMKKWFWAFSSGGRMCIGIHFAMAQMTTLVSAIYRAYTTSESAKQEGASPGITSRFEVFRDETTAACKDHECWIDFQKQS
ncbi:putative benzoate 4-monooxygenase cytochrome P450 [Pleomassaria siparia CBS 279.74]|uniref:Putative benzoate 4-monooxygenase cytochrome P450 n=1 Tax=Pleomassaria siparia CBS 279.74 TaxID=1314801 RepID=A0A6G1JXH5_9PLEO|nr:putative benzoate 4-monooxygenase cytochrome P450 [Pleomassaria siparia CBS 279.74]